MPVVDKALKQATDARYWASLSPEKRAARAARRRAQRAVLAASRRAAAQVQKQAQQAQVQASRRAARIDRVVSSVRLDPLTAAWRGVA